jgi:hypothetical protein
MSSKIDWSTVPDQDKLYALSYLIDEGFIEPVDRDGELYLCITTAGANMK